jgi:hypothetical protein
MADGIQMMDLVSLSKNLTRVRGIDPEQQAAAHRLEAAAAARDLEELHRDVEQSEDPQQARLRDRRDGRGGNRRHPEDPQAREEKPRAPVPEQDEGHLLDLKA